MVASEATQECAYGNEPETTPGHTRRVPPRPLDALTVGVTADRRSGEQSELLRRRGARIVHGPTISTEPLGPSDVVLPATRAAIAHRPEVVVFTTGLGVRSWIDVAESAGLAEDLVDSIDAATLVVARGPKARGSAATFGIDVHWEASEARASQILEHLRPQVDGRRVVVQRDGEEIPHLALALEAAGAEVVDVAVYRWKLPVDREPANRLIAGVIEGSIDIVTFTSAASARNLVTLAEEAGVGDSLREAAAQRVLVAVGDVTAEAVEALGLGPAIAPERPRLGAMTHLVSNTGAELPAVDIGGVHVRVGGSAALVGEAVLELAPQELAVFTALARKPGVVLAKAELRRTAWAPGANVDDHAVEVTVGRLRRRLPAELQISTVAKRGYRLIPG